MTSNDNNYITVEMFNARMDRFEAIIDGKFTEIKAEIRATNDRIDRTNVRIDATSKRLEFLGILAFAVIAILIAFIALILSFRREAPAVRSEDLSPRNIRDIRAIVREEIAMANRTN